MLPKPSQGRITLLLLGTCLLAAACSDDPEADSPFSPIVGVDATIPAADSGLPAHDAGGTGVPGGPLQDAGGVGIGQDAAQPASDAGSTGLPGGGDGGQTDAARASDGSADTGPGAGGDAGSGSCCPDGKCLCHGPSPTALTAERGPYMTQNYTVAGAGCVYYPTNAEPPFAAVAISDGFIGSGGCGSFQTGAWGPFYASWGIVAMIVDTGSLDDPDLRAQALLDGVAAFKAENTKSSGPLSGKLAGRYGTSGFSMGGGGTTIAASRDNTLLSDVAIMPWGPTNRGVTVPTLVICGSSDGTASCTSHGTPAYRGIAESVPKMRIVVNSGHVGQPSAGGGESGKVGLAFQKVFLEGDTRWRPLLIGANAEDTNIR
jgi:hypothetical protein